MKILKSSVKFIAVFLVGLIGFSSFSPADDFEVAKNLKLFASLMKELNTMYVDDFDPEEIIQNGMNAMVSSLDPYTVYYPEEELAGYKFQTTGKYGGIGALIRTMENDVIVVEPYEGFPAQKAGLQSGDKILTINGKSVKGLNSEGVSNLLKGNPGTKVDLRIIAVETQQEVDKTLMREEVVIKSVPFSGPVADGIVYVRLDGFTAGCHKEVKEAINKYQESNTVRGVVLDLRGNPGGLLQEAIDVSGLFLKKGTSVVSTKGKQIEWDKFFNTRRTPIDVDVPLAVLISRGSASAAEIVAGVMQDHDRGVVLGGKSFGKGLVQSTSDLLYNSKVKYTSAKYFLPSGRCVQAIDYSGRYADGAAAVSDSLRTTFTTTNNRKVFDAGGVDPDIDMKPDYISNITVSLLSKQLLFNFASDYKRRNPNKNSVKELDLSDQDFNDFLKFIEDEEYDYTSYGEQVLYDLQAVSASEGYEDLISEDLKKLEQIISRDKEQELIENKDEVLQMLREEISSRYFYQVGRMEVALDDDETLNEAVKILQDEGRYKQILNRN